MAETRTLVAGKGGRGWRANIHEHVVTEGEDGACSAENHVVASVYSKRLLPLFVAAPDLLEVVKLALACEPEDRSIWEADAQAALAKATPTP